MPTRIDANHRGPIINLAAWITLVPMVLFLMAKVFTKWRMTKFLQLDDGYMIVGTLFAIAQTINTVFQVKSGVGQHEENLTANQFDVYQKTTYISQLFYLITIALAKMASLQFLTTLTWAKEAIQMVKTILIFVVIWLLVSVLCVAFQCQVPSTWNRATGKCFNQPAFWTANAVVDITTQFLISFIPIYLLFNLQMEKDRKRVAMLAFTPNLTTIPLIIIRVIYLFKASHSNKTDLTFATSTVALISEIHTNYSIIASCIPFLRPLVESLAIGLMTNEIRVPTEDYTQSGSHSKSIINKINPFGLLSNPNHSTRNAYGWIRTPGVEATGGVYSNTITSGHKKQDGDALELVSRSEGGGYGSQERMVINQTKTTVVLSESLTEP